MRVIAWLTGARRRLEAAIHPALPRSRRAALGAIGTLLAVALVADSLYAMASSHTRAVGEARRVVEQHVRMVENHVSRLMAFAANVSNVPAGDRLLLAPVLDASAASQLLESKLVGQPSLRSLALLDDRGAVLASSDTRDVGQVVDPRQLGLDRHRDAVTFIGPLLPARSLHDLAQGVVGSSSALPLLQDLGGTPRRWLLVLVNTESFANEHSLIVRGEALRALVLQADATVVSSTAEDGPGPGTRLPELPPFTDFLPDREAGTYEGKASQGSGAVAAFRMARAWPLVVVVERPASDVERVWRSRVGELALKTVGQLALLLLCMRWLAERASRREQQVRDEAETLRRELSDVDRRWRIALDAAGHGVWELDLDHRRVRLSGGFMRILGQPDDASDVLLDFDAALRLVAAEQRAEGQQQLGQLLSGGIASLELEMQMLGADAQHRWVLSRGTVAGQRRADGRWSRVIGTATDITALKMAQQQHLASEIRLHAVVDSAMDGIVVVDGRQCVLLINPAAARIFACRPEDALGQPLSSFIRRGRQDRVPHTDWLTRRTDGDSASIRSYATGLRRNGESFPLEMAYSYFSAAGVDHYTAIVRDLTEERRLQAELLSRERRLSDLFEHAAVGMLEEGVRGDPQVPADCRYLRCNSTLCELLGYRADELLALRIDQLVHPDDLLAGRLGVLDLLAGRSRMWVQEKRLRHRDGHYLWVQAARSLIPGEDPLERRFLLVLADISARRAVQLELEQARRRETMISAHIQQSLLVSPPDQRLPGLWLSTLNQASQGADGDFVEVMQLGEGTVDVVVGDVMGKGVAAALLGAAAKMQIARCIAELMALRDGEQGLPSPAMVVAALHKSMAQNLLAVESFITLCYLRLDTRRGQVTWVGCGHEEPAIVRAEGGTSLYLSNQHPPLGILMDCEFEESVLPLGPRDCVLLASDGASDALMPDGSRIGRPFVLAQLCAHLRNMPTPGAVLHALKRDLDRRGATLTDDLTLALAMGAVGSRRELSGGLDDLPHVRGLIGHRARQAGFSDEAADLFTIGAMEAYTNAVIHTRGRPDGAPVEMVVRHDSGHIAVDFVTLGDAFETPEPVDEFDFSTYPEGGFGLSIMHRTADRVLMRHEGGVNLVTLERRVGGSCDVASLGES